MTPAEIRVIADRYQEKFGNLREIAHPSIMFDDDFAAQLQRAIDTDQKLTRADLDRIFPDIPWEE
jgi:hypothetical protein